jgi:selenocysteine lyase/cysteine desulfurase
MNAIDSFAAARRLFPHTEKVVYFNSASYGPFSTLTQKAFDEYVAMRVNAERDDSHDAFATQDQLRSTMAQLCGAQPREVGIGLNTSFGINIAAFGLPLKQGDEILTTDVEFPAAVYPWREAATQRGFQLKQIPTTDRCCDLNKLADAVTDRTRVICLSWVQFFNGYRVDLQELSEFCRRRDIFLVIDGIQGMGVESIDLSTLGVDIFSSGCQKWMLGPQGISFFYLSDRIRDQLKLPFVSWLGVDWQMNFTELFRYREPLFDSARRFEFGYYVVANLHGMAAAAQIFTDLGIEAIRDHNYILIDRLAEYVANHPFYRVTSSLDDKHRSSIFTFTCDGYERLHRQILKRKIILVQREGSIRVSVHLFNDQSDIDRLIDVLEQFAAENG